MMKKILTILLSIALVLPLYSQQDESEDYDYDYDYDYNNDDDYEYDGEFEDVTPPKEVAPKVVSPHPVHQEKPIEEPAPIPEKKKTDFARQYFEIGFGAGIGFDNGLLGLNDILKKKIVIDLAKIVQGIPEDGAGLNFSLSSNFFMNVMNIHIGKGLWDIGLIADVDGGVGMNIPKSLFTLIAEGNSEQHDSSGKISASGGIFTEIGLKGSAKYIVKERTLSFGFKPAFFVPAVYIPSSTGISYHLYTERPKYDDTGKIILDDAGKPVTEEGLFLDTKDGISIYTPTPFNHIEASRFFIGPNGFDLSLEGEYAFFPFLDIGGSLTNIPLSPATLSSEMILGLDSFSIELEGEDIISRNTHDPPEFEFGDPVYRNNVKLQVYRPLRFDLYARYKPFISELLVIRPNIGFSVNVNRGDEKWYFNAGLEAMLNLKDLFIFYLGSGYRETIWRQRAGFALNFRAFELDVEAALRNQTFVGCFMERGYELNLGIRFGW